MTRALSRAMLRYACSSLAVLLLLPACGGVDSLVPPPAEPLFWPDAGQPPPPPDTSGALGAGQAWVVRSLDLGFEADGWTHLGLDIDGFTAFDGFDSLCRPFGGANPKQVHRDGHDGRDNGFGANVASLVSTLFSQSDIDDAFSEGRSNLVLHVPNLGPDANYRNLELRAYRAAPSDELPSFKNTEEWPLAFESLEEPSDLASARFRFPETYVNDGILVAKSSLLELVLPTEPPLVLRIHHPTIVMALEPERNAPVSGAISGILDPEELAEALWDLIPALFGPKECSVSANAVAELRTNSDILRDGTQSPSETCQGISIGLGFRASPVLLGAVADPASPPPPDDCSP